MSGAGPILTSKHGANVLSSVRHIHSSILQQFRSAGFVDSYEYDFTPFGTAFFVLNGWIACRGRIVVTYTKLLPILADHGGDFTVHTARYRYNAAVQDEGNILRYDNAAHHPHPDPHHVHRFAFPTEDEVDGSPIWLGIEKWPHMSEVLDELEVWHSDNRGLLKHPDEYAMKPDRF